MSTTPDFDGKRATVMGLGTRAGGVGVARFLAERGARVTVTDLRPADDLAEALLALGGLPIAFALGHHPEALFTPAGADFVVRNPGVPRRAPMLQLARANRLPIEMEMTLFCRACPAPILGVTGTKGKTTVSTLSADLLRQWDDRTVLAGNMGVSALDRLPEITPTTPVVLELSSWQIEGLLEHEQAPSIAVLTSIAEDHLNTYADFAEYAATKRGITTFQRPGDVLVMNRDDPEAWRAAAETRAHVVPFGVGDRGEDGAWFDAGDAIWRWGGEEHRFPIPETDPFRGEHARRNALAAVAAAVLRGAPPEAIRSGLTAFRGVADRMETVAEVAGVRFINDTTATAPVAAAAALDALAGTRVHLLCGGADKKLDPAPLIEAITRHCPLVYLFEGTATPELATRLAASGIPVAGPFRGMVDAVAAAIVEAAPRDVVLLSPGCASFGLFRDEFDRGEQFREVVRTLDAAHGAAARTAAR